MSDAAHPDVSLEIDLDGVELKSVIVPQDFLPGGSSDWARLRFAGLERGRELVVGKMVGDAGAKKLEFDIDVCLWATGKVSSSWSPYEWLIVSYVEGRAFRMRAGRRMMVSPREVLRPR